MTKRSSLALCTGMAWCIVPIVPALLLTSPSVTLPADDLGLRRFRTPHIAPDVRLSQTFTMTTGGLHAIEVSATSAAETVSGDVRVELYDVTLESGPRPLVRSAEVRAADLVKAPSYRFEFPPIPDSKDRDYRLDLVSSDSRRAEGVAFWATKGERYEGGALLVNNQPRWADLAFRTHAPAPSRWQLLMTLRQTNPGRAHIVLAAFAATWLLLGVIFARWPAFQ